MVKVIVRRIVELAVALFLITSATFFLLAAIPGDALSAQTNNLPEAARQRVYAQSGLNKPVLERYATTMTSMLHGNFGESIADPGMTMSKVVHEKLPVSLRLGLQQVLLGIPLGLFFGILAAIYKNTWVDHTVTVLSLLLMSVPSLVLGLLLQSYFGGKLGWFPILGWPEGSQLWFGGWTLTILPTVAGALTHVATYARLLKNSMLDILGSDYVQTARAKGVPEYRVVTHHIVRNAAIPVITRLPMTVAFSITGSVFIESIFVIPGIGQYFVQALNNRDVPIVMGETVMLAALYIGSLFLTDLLYMAVDPRIKLYDRKEG